jgi:hypothetical protein
MSTSSRPSSRDVFGLLAQLAATDPQAASLAYYEIGVLGQPLSRCSGAARRGLQWLRERVCGGGRHVPARQSMELTPADCERR